MLIELEIIIFDKEFIIIYRNTFNYTLEDLKY
jgi:hypothetical protein